MKTSKKHSEILTAFYLIFPLLFEVLPIMAEESSPGQLAEEIFEACNIKGGLVVHLGCGNGRLTAELRANESYIVHGLERDAARVEIARRNIREFGLYGEISITRLQGTRLPYADNMVNLLVAERPARISNDEIMRVLAPRGVAYLKRNGKWAKKTKSWPDEIDEWTHWLHDASGNAVARDRLVGPPRHVQWMAKPLWQRHHDTVPSTTAMVSANGRLFYISDEAPACLDASVPDNWFLVARDAFNGLPLWKRPINEWGWNQWSADWKGRFNEPPQLPKRLVAAGDKVYVTLNYNALLTALGATTGEVLRTYEGTNGTDEILYRDGLLVLSLNKEARKPSKEAQPPVKKSVCVIEADTGEVLWKKGDYSGLRGKFNSTDPFGRLELALGGDQVFLVDHHAILSLDLKSGEQRWHIDRPDIAEHQVMYGIRMSDMCVLLYQDGVVLFAQPRMKKKRSWQTLPGTLYAYRAETGELLWEHPYGGWSHNWQPDVFVVDGLVWVFEHLDIEFQGHEIRDKSKLDYAMLGLDLKTGKVNRRFSTAKTFNVGHHHRCYRNKATERFVLASRRGVEFLDLASGENHLHHWARGACLHGIVPANGLLYLTPHPCDCYIETKLNGYIALAPQAESANRVEKTGADDNSFEQGPAYGKVRKTSSAGKEDWPTFRRDALRSGSTQTLVPAELDIAWHADIGGRLSPPVAANGRVVVTSIDRHQVAAIDAADGKPIWNFTAGGRVDTPPTIHKGLALFGSADGWAYCLRAADGRLVWRRRLAPQERLIGAFGQLESAWPVHGSILIKDDIAYAAAGRSSYLDSGIYLYALDPATGKILEEEVLYSPDDPANKIHSTDAKKQPGVLADILVSDGASVFMRQEKVFDRGNRDNRHLVATAGLRDDDWFNRTRWAIGAMTVAQLIVFDDKTAYGVQAYPGKSRWHFFEPATKGYLLFAGELEKQRADKHSAASISKAARDAKLKRLWTKRVPLRITAMVHTREKLFTAGTPDVVKPEDPLGAIEGRLGGVLCAFNAADGEKSAEYKLKSPPVPDGLIAANGRLYLAARDGTLVCYDKK
ncbi:MAG: outer membrane protein assembly factor BamB family protein [Planctomycetota bacterium]